MDRTGSFEPLLIPKFERRFTGFDDKIVAMYARGMTVREIQGVSVMVRNFRGRCDGKSIRCYSCGINGGATQYFLEVGCHEKSVWRPGLRTAAVRASGLNLLTVPIVLWNTVYLEWATQALCAVGKLPDGRWHAPVPVAAGLGAHQPNRGLCLAAADWRKSFTYYFFRILWAPSI